MYRKFNHSAKFLRQLYNGDNIEFYRDFIRSNQECFDSTIMDISIESQLRPVEMFAKMLRKFNVPYEKQLLELMRYDFNYQRLRDSKDGTVMQDVYHFNYQDMLDNLPIEQYSNHSCLIRLEKQDGTITKQGYLVE